MLGRVQLIVIFTFNLSSHMMCQLICHQANVTCSEHDLVKIYWNLNGLHQESQYLIDFIKSQILIPPSPLPVELYMVPSVKNMMGQFEQVPLVEKLLGLKRERRRKGFFVEAGASCGQKFSNTLYLELKYGWSGLLIEPNPDLLAALLGTHRNSWVFPHCISTLPFVQVVTFDASDYNSGIISSATAIKPSLLDRDLNKQPILDFERELQVQCFPLFAVLKALGNPVIDYFSLDIEGAEYMVLQTLPWNKINMTLLSVEVNHAGVVFPGNRTDIWNLLKDQGFEHTATAKIDDFFLHKSFNEMMMKQNLQATKQKRNKKYEL